MTFVQKGSDCMEKWKWKWLMAAALVLLLMPVMGVHTIMAAKEKEKTETSVTDNGNGTFDVVYDNTEGAGIVVMVSKDEVDYKYFLSEGIVTEVIPLTLGNG